MLQDPKEKTLSLVITILPLIIISLAGQKCPAIFQYDRSAIIEGQYWRIVTCHFVHTGWEHLLLSLIGVALLFGLFARLYSLFAWLTGALCCMIGISLSFLVFCPTLEWYKGLSGLLHGLLVMGIVGEIRNGNKFYYLLLLAITGKLALEYFYGPADLTSQFTNAVVITSAHLAGAIAGGMTGCIILLGQILLPDQSMRIPADHAA
ncbi:MAG: rhombosortase [Deltaproteobacteria bacterium]